LADRFKLECSLWNCMSFIKLANCNSLVFSNFQSSKLFTFQLEHDSWKKDERDITLKAIKSFPMERRLKRFFMLKNICQEE